MNVLAPRPLRRIAVAACAGALAVGTAACGSSDSGSAAPASAVPASAPIYMELTVRPEGALKTDTEAALKKILGTNDVRAELEKLFQDSDTKLADIEPWLGEKAGIFFTSFSGTNAEGAVVVDSKDDGKAAEALNREAGPDAKKETYKDVEYTLDGDTAQGVTDGFAIVGTVRGFRTVVDTLKGDVATMEDSDERTKALAAVGEGDALADVYINTQQFFDAVSRSGGLPPEALAGVRGQIAALAGTSFAAKLRASGSAVAVDTAATGATQSSTAPAAGDAAAAVAALPGDAWFALGIGALGSKLEQTLEQAAQVGGLAGVDVNQVFEQIRQASGIDINEDLVSWMGDAAVFARGTSKSDIGGALVVESSSPETTKEVIRKIGRLLRNQVPDVTVRQLSGVPGAEGGIVITPTDDTEVEILLTTAGDRFIAAIGRQALEAAIDPQTTLGDSAGYKAAAAAVGGGIAPTFFVDIAPVLQLADGMGAGNGPEWEQAKAIIGRFAAIAAGGKIDGDVQRGRLAVTLK